MPFSAICRRCGYRTYGTTYLEATSNIVNEHCNKAGHSPLRDVSIDNCPKDEYEAWKLGRSNPIYWFAVRNSRRLVAEARSH